MSEFVFLFRGRVWRGSPEQQQKTLEKWGAWMTELNQAQWERSYNLRPSSRRSALYNRSSNPRCRLDRDPILARIRISGPLDAVI
jgi:hypothetical protein